MIKHGVALVRLSSSSHGAAAGSGFEEFYAVMFDGRVLETRFSSYADAMRHCETMWKAVQDVRADVA